MPLDLLGLGSRHFHQSRRFPSPSPNILQLARVLEIHSLEFPTDHAYSMMCYWYADSTFEILADIGKANQKICGEPAQKKGVFTYKGVDYIAYTGITRTSFMRAGILSSTPPATSSVDEDELYQRE